ncbi:class I SAM-dependent DNA methyltransferase [Agrobacterium salinitolerans]|uniref:site-specific DNA-methyltransferase (adenine-specific) n=1 Tax=Agrobacterium salinitolerans TaxID=1183413 RepID=A0ABY3BW32_9HYPH|nr:MULTISPECIES: DNA methyltransferase [Agrobacterium]MCZ7890051.1 class I SAM-dependent DNA methyltransferase [Agrobacterium salinitolerans]TRA97255.1 class I SAM-dependent DNA methyltransferase [Agrobacterium salinitolerans]
MNPQEFLAKWRSVELKERTASQSHFNDLCGLLGVDDPITADPKGEWFTFEKGASKTSGGEGWADVWRKGCFAWEYKGRAANLDRAFDQLLRYSIALESPPLLIVSDMERIRVHTNWTNTVQQVHEIALEDLADAAKRDLLRACFEDPEQLRPTKTRQALTEEAAREFATLAQRLRDRGNEAHQVAHFINRLVFCMFAEDVGLLPNNMFMRMLEASRSDASQFSGHAQTLFAAMRSGGMVGFERVEWFNGGLFDDDGSLPLEEADVKNLLAAARLDWSEVDPSILGTLFERGLDPDKRSQLGAHYTDRDKIMQIVRPVIVAPLQHEWAEAKAAIQKQMDKLAEAKARVPATQAEARKVHMAARRAEEAAFRAAKELHAKFIERLRNFRVLDPACGSGNFLYLSLLTLKDIEHRANLDAETLGLGRFTPLVGPENVLGMELNPYAAELARVSVWVGEIQWMRRNGFNAARNPILRSLGNIECRDAVLAEDGSQAEWPEADVVVGNPPFLGSKFHRKGRPATKKKLALKGLGDEYVDRLYAAYKGEVPASADLVSYWFAKVRSLAEGERLAAVGLIATKSVGKGTSNKPLTALVTQTDFRIFSASRNEPWVVDGADVRVAIVCVSRSPSQFELDGKPSGHINPDLTSGLDISQAKPISENRNVAFQGVKLNGPFEIDGALARSLLKAPTNPNGKSNSEVVRRFAGNDDVTMRDCDAWVLDFTKYSDLDDAILFEKPFQWVKNEVSAHRQTREVGKATEVERLEKFWLMQRPRPKLRSAAAKFKRIIAVPETSEHLLFRFIPRDYVFSGSLFAVCRDDDLVFGVLSSRIHMVWARAHGNQMGVGNQGRYNATRTFLTFPFPEGLTPDVEATELANDPRAMAIATASARLNELRENWLNPPGLVRYEPEVVPNYPDRILPVDEDAAKELAKRTLTNLYNEPPAWLDQAHLKLDEAVADAYGWGGDFRAGKMTDDEILARLFQLNQERTLQQNDDDIPRPQDAVTSAEVPA